MDEEKLEQQAEQAQPVKYATPMQRLWAWVGVVYMILLVLLSTYALAHGAYLRGIGGLMLSPALCGLGCSAIVRFRQGVGRGGIGSCVIIAGASFLLALLGAVKAIPAILEQL